MKRFLLNQPGPTASRLEAEVPTQEDDQPEIGYVRWLTQMQTDLAETLGGVVLRAARPYTLSFGTATNSLVSGSAGRLVGWSIRESAGINPVVLRLRNGDAFQPIIAEAYASAGSVANQFWGSGISFTEGLYLEIVTGAGLSTSVEGTLYLGSAD